MPALSNLALEVLACLPGPGVEVGLDDLAADVFTMPILGLPLPAVPEVEHRNALRKAIVEIDKAGGNPRVTLRGRDATKIKGRQMTYGLTKEGYAWAQTLFAKKKIK